MSEKQTPIADALEEEIGLPRSSLQNYEKVMIKFRQLELSAIALQAENQKLREELDKAKQEVYQLCTRRAELLGERDNLRQQNAELVKRVNAYLAAENLFDIARADWQINRNNFNRSEMDKASLRKSDTEKELRAAIDAAMQPPLSEP